MWGIRMRQTYEALGSYGINNDSCAVRGGNPILLTYFLEKPDWVEVWGMWAGAPEAHYKEELCVFWNIAVCKW